MDIVFSLVILLDSEANIASVAPADGLKDVSEAPQLLASLTVVLINILIL